MRKIDYHMHTYFSADSEANPREHIQKAIEMGLEEICFTDHEDFHYPGTPFDVDINAYLEQMLPLKEEYKGKINVKVGIEVGLDCLYYDEIETFIQAYPFDYVIGSIHTLNDMEFYLPGKFFEGKTKEEAHREFFEETLRCVEKFDYFNCLGHLDYIMRYGPYEDKTVNHALYQDIIDEIYKTLIRKGKGIEVNTSGFKNLKSCGFPNYEQIQRYYNLGGRIITIGTDSHTSDRVGEHVNEVIEELKRIGFEDVTTFTQRQRDNV